jgi:hypothetical protein
MTAPRRVKGAGCRHGQANTVLIWASLNMLPPVAGFSQGPAVKKTPSAIWHHARQRSVS